MRCYRIVRQRHFVKRIVFLTPECRTVSLVEHVGIAVFVCQICVKLVFALVAPAHVATLVSQLVVYLPRDYACFVFVMLGKCTHYLFAIFHINLAAETIGMPAAENTLSSVFVRLNDIGVLMDKPRGRGSRRSTDDYFELPCLCLGNNVVKIRKIVFALSLFHSVPRKLAYSYDVAPQLANTVKVAVRHQTVPLFGIIVHTQKHKSLLKSQTCRILRY